MPTASTAQILGNCESIEPYTSNVYSRRVLSGDHQVTIITISSLLEPVIPQWGFNAGCQPPPVKGLDRPGTLEC